MPLFSHVSLHPTDMRGARKDWTHHVAKNCTGDGKAAKPGGVATASAVPMHRQRAADGVRYLRGCSRMSADIEAQVHDTFPKLLLRNARRRPDRPAMREKDHGIWQSWTWREVLDEVRALACGLAALGANRGDKVAIIGDNRPQLYMGDDRGPVAGRHPRPGLPGRRGRRGLVRPQPRRSSLCPPGGSGTG